MKRVSLLLGAMVLSSATASAADLPVKAPPLTSPVPAYTWTGFYVGANLGYGGNDNETDNVRTVSGAGFPLIGAGRPLYGGSNNFQISPAGFLGGVQGGYNWQPSQNVVLGIEADFQGSGIKDSINCVLACGTAWVTTTPPNILNNFPVIFATDSYSRKIDWFGTVRGRLGYTGGPWLIYVTGGLAYGDVQRSGSVVGRTAPGGGPGTTNAFAGSFAASSTQVGWTAGAGAEFKIPSNPAWSIKGEYLYVDLGSNTDTFNTIFTQGGGGAVVGTVAATRTDTSSNREHIFRVGVNYGFNMPVVAKY